MEADYKSAHYKSVVTVALADSRQINYEVPSDDEMSAEDESSSLLLLALNCLCLLYQPAFLLFLPLQLKHKNVLRSKIWVRIWFLTLNAKPRNYVSRTLLLGGNSGGGWGCGGWRTRFCFGAQEAPRFLGTGKKHCIAPRSERAHKVENREIEEK